MANRIPQRAIFWQDDRQVYLVSNWRNRFVKNVRPIILRLGPNHLKQYREQLRLGRSEKSIYYLLFKKSITMARRRNGVKGSDSIAKGAKVLVRLDILSADQLSSIVSEMLGHQVLGLRPLGLQQLRKMVLDLQPRHAPK